MKTSDLLKTVNLLIVVAVVAEDTSDHLTSVGLEIHWCIPVIHIACCTTAGSDTICNGTTGELPSAILMMVTMIAVHSCNVLI